MGHAKISVCVGLKYEIMVTRGCVVWRNNETGMYFRNITCLTLSGRKRAALLSIPGVLSLKVRQHLTSWTHIKEDGGWWASQ